MSQRTVYAKQVPPISQEFFNELDDTFTFPMPSPGTPIDEIMFHAGQRYVIEWCRKHVRGHGSDVPINRVME